MAAMEGQVRTEAPEGQAAFSISPAEATSANPGICPEGAAAAVDRRAQTAINKAAAAAADTPARHIHRARFRVPLRSLLVAEAETEAARSGDMRAAPAPRAAFQSPGPILLPPPAPFP